MINRMMTQIIEDMWAAGYDMPPLPHTRFFTGTEHFWQQLKALDKIWIECGAGSGHTTAEASGHDVTMIGCDIYTRSNFELNPLIQIVPAHMMPYSGGVWPLICRPDHSGWVSHLFDHTRNTGCGFVYVSREEKMEDDVGNNDWDFKHEDIGDDNESMFVWFPHE